MSYQIAAIPANLVNIMWDRVKPHIDRVVAIAPDEIDSEIVKQRALVGDLLIVTISKCADIVAALVLEVREFDTGIKALYIPVVGGDELSEWMDQFLDVAHAIAKDFECTQLRGIAARKGWLKVLQTKGWEEVCTIIKCEVGK